MAGTTACVISGTDEENVLGKLRGVIYGLMPARDGVTVRETFAFSSVTDRVEGACSPWKFLRRDMEDGPQAVQAAVSNRAGYPYARDASMNPADLR